MKLLASGLVCGTLLGFAACSSTGNVGGSTPDAAIDSPQGVDDSNEIPCAPRAVLQTVCQHCHTNPPQNGAPFPLVTRTDILTMRSGGIASDLMIAQLQAHRMPLAPVTITDEQRATLLSWLQGGDVAVSPQTCEDAGTSDAALEAGPDAKDAGADAADAAESDSSDADLDAPTD